MTTHAEAYRFWESIDKGLGIKSSPAMIEYMIREYGGTEESVNRNLSRYAKEQAAPRRERVATLPPPATRRPDFPRPAPRPPVRGRRPALLELIFPMPRNVVALVLVILFVWPITISFAAIAIPLYPFYLMAKYF